MTKVTTVKILKGRNYKTAFVGLDSVCYVNPAVARNHNSWLNMLCKLCANLVKVSEWYKHKILRTERYRCEIIPCPPVCNFK